MAMEARCYRGDMGRTRMKEMKFHKRDLAATILLILFVAATVVEAILV